MATASHAAPLLIGDRPSGPPEGRGPRLGWRWRDHRDAPLVRSGINLIASSGLTSVLGLAYWSLAAHRYTPAAIGATAGLLAAMELIAAIANLGLRTALIRFVPSLGRQATRVVALSYVATGAIALVGGAAFVALHGRLFPELTLLDQAPGAAFFLVSTVLWVVFILQDSVLIGLRRSFWLPVENTAFALVKLGLLFALSSTLPVWGVYVSWTAPLLAVVVIVNIAVFRWLRHGARRATETLSIGDLVRFSAGDYAASALWLATIDALPLLVLALAGARANAWYSLAWTVAYTLYLIPSAVGSALLAEAAHDGPALEANTRRSLVMSLALVVPAALFLAVAAPLVLAVFGRQYSTDASTLLRLMALSAIPYVVTILYVNVERARRRIAAVVRLYAATCAAIVLSSAALLPHFGVAATGVAWLVVQSALCLWVLLVPLRDLWVRALPTSVIRRIGIVPGWLADRRLAAKAHRQVPRVLAQVCPGASWSLLHATSDLLVARVRPPSGPDLVLKLPCTEEAERSRRREMRALATLATDPRTADWAVVVPRVVDEGVLGGQPWSLETAVDGITGSSALGDLVGPDRLLATATTRVLGLHRATAELRVVDDALLDAWVDRPAAVVRAACSEAADGVDDLVRTLRLVLAGRTATVSWVHGDVSPANLLVDRRGEVVGLVDWEAAGGSRLPELDLVGLIAAVRAQTQTAEVGEVALDLLRRPWTEEEVATLAHGPNTHLPRHALVLMAWLHHVATNLTKSGGYAGNRVWLVRNVAAFAEALVMPASVPATVGGPGAPEAPAPASAGGPATLDVPGRALPPDDRAPRREQEAPAPDRRLRAGAAAAARRHWRWAIPPLAVVVWFASLAGTTPSDLTDVGLMSALTPLSFLAFAALAAGFAAVLVRRPWNEGLAVAHVGGLVTLLFATPAVIYPTVRYSWAWKHMGIVDYIGRHGSVDPGIDVLPIYHNWPGFFAGSHLLQSWMGAENVITVARWAPFVVTLATAGAVSMLAATFTKDRRVVWLTAWLFLLGDWVGQEYFSPQALCYLLYLVAITLALRMARRPTRRSGGRHDLTIVAVILLTVVIATSHQITPAMLCVALIALTATRRAKLLVPAVVAVVVTVTWAVWGAADFVVANVKMALEGFGSPMANAEGSLVDARLVSHGQALVALAGRGVVLTIGVLYALGVVRVWRRDRDTALTMIVLLVAPMVILATNEFGGEILFRVYLFALPAAAWFAAQALLDPPRVPTRLAAVAPLVISLLLFPGFVLAHFGKDGHYVFTQDEYVAARWLDEHAPAGSLLVEGSANYPTQFRNYEHFRYVPLDTESAGTRAAIHAHPAASMRRWLSDANDTASYLLLTRSQMREADVMGYQPAGFLQDLEAALRASDRFRVVFQDDDAVIFSLKEGAR